MTASHKAVAQPLSLGICSLLLIFLLAACGGGNGNTTSATPTPTPSPTPIPLQTYSGTGYTIGYPTGWTPTNQQGLGVAITDPLKNNAVSVFTIPTPGAPKTADQIATDETTTLIPLVLHNAKPVTGVAPKTTLAGDTWTQKAFTGTGTANGQEVPLRIYMLVDVHPAHAPTSQAFVILYGGPDITFVLENLQHFQTMLQSFKFTS